ncbi:MAG TPA: substrate-binding domain-containing protein [Micromonosporaceae bacterium]
MPQKVTIATVARRARVSRQTVSNVINSPQVVREETRRRVLQAIDDLGYRASQAARLMRTGRSRLIAARIEPTRDGITGSVLDRFLHGLTETAESAGYRVLVYTAAGADREIAAYEALVASYDLDGFVLTGTKHADPRVSWLAARDVAFVAFGRAWDQPDRHPWVDVDGADGTAQATRHLIDTGHRRIGYVGWPEGSGVGDDRRAGWLAAMRDAALDTGRERRVPDGIGEGAAALRALLDAADPPTAVVCCSDSLALGALPVARGVDPPVAVIGFDDTPVAPAVGLSSVSQPLAGAAACCVDLLAGLLDGRSQQAPSHVLLRPTLVLRHSG